MNKIIIGLTGPTGAGKSSVSAIAEQYGFKVINCDLSARRATEKNTDGLKALVKAFGKEILTLNGELNRKALARIAFSSKENTELLNKTILPFIVRVIIDEISDENALLDAPTLFESGISSICFKTIAVLAYREIRLKRIMSRDKLTIEEASLRINAGKHDEFYKANADYIIYNNGDEQACKNRFSDIIKGITGGNIDV